MAFINKQDTNGTKATLTEGEFGYDKQGTDRGRVYVGTNAGNVALAKKTEVDSKISANQIITLSGDVSGSGTTSISVTVADDSHNHIISNIDGLQTALDGKQPSGTYNTIIGTDTDINTSGATIIDNIYVTDGVITSMGARTFTAWDIGAAEEADFAHVTFRGTSAVYVYASKNVSSVSDLGVGKYRVNFSSLLSSSYPTVTGNHGWGNSCTTTQQTVAVYGTNNANTTIYNYDSWSNCGLNFRDNALMFVQITA